jgi:hypothetical protein
MIMAFRRTIGTATISMITAVDWRTLKIHMCDEWQIEEPFNTHRVWDQLRWKNIVTYDGDMFQVWNPYDQGDFAEELFQGRHIEVLDEESTP